MATAAAGALLAETLGSASVGEPTQSAVFMDVQRLVRELIPERPLDVAGSAWTGSGALARLGARYTSVPSRDEAFP